LILQNFLGCLSCNNDFKQEEEKRALKNQKKPKLRFNQLMNLWEI